MVIERSAFKSGSIMIGERERELYLLNRRLGASKTCVNVRKKVFALPGNQTPTALSSSLWPRTVDD